jgi:hypothetical protein
MATIYEVQAPDGSILEIEGPDGATEAQIMQAAAELYQPQQQAAPQQPGQVPQFGSMETAAEIPGLEQPYPAPQPEPTMGEYATGAAETLGTMATGATTGLLGAVGGAVEGTARSIAGGQYKTEGFAPMAAEYAQRGMQAGTYEPRGRVAPEVLKAIGEPLSQLPPVLGAGGLPTAGRAARAGAALPREMVSAGIERLPGAAGRAETARSVGAAQTPESLRRVAIAESMPVKFEGETGLTLGQAARDFELLRDEKELAKNPELGRRLRERTENQSAALQQNFDYLFETIGPRSVEDRDIGQAVDRALVTRMKVQKKKVDNLYEQAREAGETLAPVEMVTMPELMALLDKHRNAGNSTDISREIVRIGAAIKNDDGSYSPGTIALNDAELLRQDVNEFTDIYAPKEARIRRMAIKAIDDATENSGGPIYRDARKARAKFAQEFENVGITKRLLAEKKGTSERTIAFEDVFKKVILDSSIEEINKLRVTLLKGGSEGKQAWQDLKAQLIDNIKQSSLSGSGSDSRGLPLLSPDKLSKKIAELDRRGKLEALYGKKQAQIMRDLAEIARAIYTAPPGAVNAPGTTSALMVALDAMGGFMVSGMPIPAATLVREGAKYSKNKALIARVEEILKPVR